MKTIELSTFLPAAPAVVCDQLMRPALLNYVAAGLLAFRAVDPPSFPARWTPGEYRVQLLALHFLPLGWQVVGVEFPAEGDDWVIRDRGRGALARTWDHRIYVTAEGDGTRYADVVRIEAGLLTPLVILFARVFYRYRQRRWRRLARHGFRPLAARGEANPGAASAEWPPREPVRRRRDR